VICRGRLRQESRPGEQKTFFIVVGVNEPTGDAFGAGAADFADPCFQAASRRRGALYLIQKSRLQLEC